MRTFWFAAGLAVSMLSFAGGAAANKPKEEASADDAGAQARGHYDRGTTLYDLNRFDDAVKEFEAAYEIKHEPVLLYNIAQSYRLASRYTEALRFYRTYLRKYYNTNGKDPANKADVEQKIADMEKLMAEQSGQPGTRPTPAPSPSSPAPAPRPAATGSGSTQLASATQPSGSGGRHGESTSPPRHEEVPPASATPSPEPKPKSPSAPMSPKMVKVIAGAIVGVVGLGLVATGVYFGLQAQQAATAQMNSTNAQGMPIFDPDAESRGMTDQTIGLALDIVGGLAVAAGVGVIVWGVVQKPERSSTARAHNLQLAPALGRSYAGGSLHLEF